MTTPTEETAVPRTVTEILTDIRKITARRVSGKTAVSLVGALADAHGELADALGDVIEASAWILDDDEDGPSLWVLSGVDDLTGMAAYDLLELGVDEVGELNDRRRALSIEDVYGIRARGPAVLLRRTPA